MYAVNAVAPSRSQRAQAGRSIYEDTGCEVAGACLECPLSRCKFDDMEWFTKYRQMAQDLRIVAAVRKERLTIAQTAARFSITKRTVFRILHRCQDAWWELTPEEAAVFASLAD